MCCVINSVVDVVFFVCECMMNSDEEKYENHKIVSSACGALMRALMFGP